ncbi:MAG: S8 family serine peptidase [Egibacteraceae bacterium]
MASIISSSAADRGFHDEEIATTGRYVVVFSDAVQGDSSAQAEALSSIAGVTNIASSFDFTAGALDVGETASADATIFAQLGIAVMQGDPSQFTSLATAAAEDNPRILAVEPERILYAIQDPGAVPLDYVRGYRDGVVDLSERLFGNGATGAAAQAAETFLDDTASTWGLKATKVVTSGHTGQGIRVAVLDTGIALDHPDYAGRVVESQSFVPGEDVQDGNSHGTHCVGTSCGSVSPANVRRYGVAYGADIFAGKVLGNAGSGSDTYILAGIEWAIANGCRVISMSLGANIRRPSAAYDTVGRRALAAGSLIIAAAGNNASRGLGNPGFVGMPANSPSIMAVGALDNQLRVANFSAQSNPVDGGQIDIAGPGVAVFSSVPMATRHGTKNGTSMATPHVAGIAALWSQATGATGEALWSILTREARRLDLPSLDVGAGLAQAPQ